MRKINTITRYDVQYGKQVDFNPCIIRSVITDSGIDAQTYGDADFEENGLYEFNREAFAEIVSWLAEQEDDYFAQYSGYLDISNCKACRREIVNAFKTILDANKSDKDVVRIEIY